MHKLRKKEQKNGKHEDKIKQDFQTNRFLENIDSFKTRTFYEFYQ